MRLYISKVKINLPVSLFLFCLLLSSCGSNKLLYNPSEVAHLSQRLGIEIRNDNKEDDENMPLYAEAASWLGVPYRAGGMDKKGTDCSGLTHTVFRKVYRKKLSRSSGDQAKNDVHKVSKKNLKTGDLVFFSTGKKNKINHVGIYLKNNKFIHASSSRGVIISGLDENYYLKTWKNGGRVK
ncbi:cell wall-associated NlpC family hydrolase [Dysgonomonas sp. PH5-45]|uniref:C40 family peptidase n=1 Tax=unclassified Dysgonomonas TaxID=2630389 RepID=UPI002476DE36|nr:MULTISPECIES: C40 family peptidase [unclassified Dysgonomonas]MDH6355783.1 cell wall-associated NlpC family hydrolase [Dysgonomonas sp. PH5-45]MDH6388680.1 cell wall-associated NlpC family hydrolase [Dysgonomonas sp. PH5-37]